MLLTVITLPIHYYIQQGWHISKLVVIYLYSSFVPSWLVTGRDVSFKFTVDARLSCIFDNHNRFTITDCAGSLNEDWNSVIRRYHVYFGLSEIAVMCVLRNVMQVYK